MNEERKKGINRGSRQVIQIFGGLGLMLTGYPLAMGIGTAAAIEALVEEPIRELITRQNKGSKNN